MEQSVAELLMIQKILPPIYMERGNIVHTSSQSWDGDRSMIVGGENCKAPHEGTYNHQQNTTFSTSIYIKHASK